MKPPARKSRKSTERKLVTRAVTSRPRTSKRISSPSSIWNRSRRRLLDRHLGIAVDGASSHHSRRRASRWLRGRPVGDGELARQPAAPAHVLVALEVDVAPAHADDAGAQHGDQLRRRHRRSRVDERRHAVALRRLDVHQEHVRRVLAHLQGEVLSRLACSARTPRMKKAPRPTASRMTRVWLPGRATCSTACRSANDARVAQRLHRADERGAGQMQHERDRRRTRRTAPDPRAAIRPARRPRRRASAPTAAVDAPLQPVESRPVEDVLPQQQRRLDVPDLEQRHHREQHRHEQADRQALHDARRASGRIRRQHAPRDRRRMPASRSTTAGDRDAQRLPASPSSSTCAR